MVFFAGIIAGAVLGALAYRCFYTIQCSKAQVVCNEAERDKELYKQLERLIAYGNDM